MPSIYGYLGRLWPNEHTQWQVHATDFSTDSNASEAPLVSPVARPYDDLVLPEALWFERRLLRGLEFRSTGRRQVAAIVAQAGFDLRNIRNIRAAKLECIANAGGSLLRRPLCGCRYRDCHQRRKHRSKKETALFGFHDFSPKTHGFFFSFPISALIGANGP